METQNTIQPLSEGTIIEVLDFIVSKMRDKDVVWRFDGGINLLVRWVPRIPKDIDIRTNKTGYEAIKQIFSNLPIQEKQNESRWKLGSKHYALFDIKWVEVEVAYYEWEDENMDMFENIINKERNGIPIPVLSLSETKYFYEWIWSTQKVDLINTFLGQQK